MTRRHLVLVGAGHAQLDLLAAMRSRPLADWDASLITPQPVFSYSGMLPGIMAGSIPPADAQVPVAAIARAAGLRVHEASVLGMDAQARRLTLSNGDTVGFDLLSLDVGSSTLGLDTPGAAKYAFPMRPFVRALDLLTQLDAAMLALPRWADVPVVIVGAGAAGVEIAFALRERIRAAGRVPRVTLVDATAVDGLPLSGFNEQSRRVAGDALRRRDIALISGRVTQVRADSVDVANGRASCVLPSLATAWISGPAAHAWLARSGLACDSRGYPLAQSTLALNESGSIFGGGDCITLRDAVDTPKAGVYAVRMAPVLAHNVIATARALPADQRYVPQRDFLALLSTGDGRAILRWRGIALESRWAQWLKSRIDQRYLARYRTLAGLPPAELYRPPSIPPPPELP